MRKPIINQSRVYSWRNCRQAYHYKYVEEIVPKRIARPLAFGTIVHQMLEAGINVGHPDAAFTVLRNMNPENKRIFKEEKEYYGAILDDITLIMDEYFNYWPDSELTFLPIGPEKKRSEIKFQLEQKRFIAEGTMDAIARTPNRMVWLVEHKTHSDLPSEDHRWRNLQSAVYLTAIKELKLAKPSGVVWNYISSKSPTLPEYLEKSARLSKREIVTLPNVVMAQLQAHGLSADEPNHRELLDAAIACRQRYFQRIYTPLSPRVTALLWQGFVDTAHEIIDNAGKRDKNISRACEWCGYEPLCRAELTGGDLASVKKNDFQPDPKRESANQSSGKDGDGVATPRPRRKRTPLLRTVR
jgi:hypothetical protein